MRDGFIYSIFNFLSISKMPAFQEVLQARVEEEVIQCHVRRVRRVGEDLGACLEEVVLGGNSSMRGGIIHMEPEIPKEPSWSSNPQVLAKSAQDLHKKLRGDSSIAQELSVHQTLLVKECDQKDLFGGPLSLADHRGIGTLWQPL